MCKDLKLTNSSLRALVDQCATKSLLTRLEIFTETLATKSALHDLKNEVSGKSSIVSQNCLQQEIEQMRKDFSLVNKTAASKSEEIQRFRVEISKQFSEIRKDMEEMNVQLVEDSNIKAQKVTDLGQLVQNIDSKVTDFSGVVNKRLELCVPRIDLDRMRFELKSYATLEELQTFREEIQPVLDGCNMLLKQYAAENEDMRQCVLQFDQTIAQKADKWNITELKTQIQKDYLAIKDFDSRA